MPRPSSAPEIRRIAHRLARRRIERRRRSAGGARMRPSPNVRTLRKCNFNARRGSSASALRPIASRTGHRQFEPSGSGLSRCRQRAKPRPKHPLKRTSRGHGTWQKCGPETSKLAKLERAMGIEPTTYSLGSCRSTTELRPRPAHHRHGERPPSRGGVHHPPLRGPAPAGRVSSPPRFRVQPAPRGATASGSPSLN